jgi:hypothetical protein
VNGRRDPGVGIAGRWMPRRRRGPAAVGKAPARPVCRCGVELIRRPPSRCGRPARWPTRTGTGLPAARSPSWPAGLESGGGGMHRMEDALHGFCARAWLDLYDRADIPPSTQGCCAPTPAASPRPRPRHAPPPRRPQPGRRPHPVDYGTCPNFVIRKRGLCIRSVSTEDGPDQSRPDRTVPSC